jgi:hypothetical protein
MILDLQHGCRVRPLGHAAEALTLRDRFGLRCLLVRHWNLHLRHLVHVREPEQQRQRN